MQNRRRLGGAASKRFEAAIARISRMKILDEVDGVLTIGM